jgi:ABC-2 type transport system ATP-binding protein
VKPVKVEHLAKSFGDVKAVKDVNIEAEQGKVVGLLGPNGAGKSTTIKILTGQISRDSGDVSILDIDPKNQPVKLREKLGILPEREDPPSFLTGSEYLEFISDIRDEEIDEDYWIEELNLEGKMGSLTSDLSKGERQKLMIIQAFFHDPEVVFIDEPLINLDPVIQERVKKLFKEFRDDGGTIILSTHVVSLAQEICDEVFFIRQGETVEELEDVENLKDRFLDEYDT